MSCCTRAKYVIDTQPPKEDRGQMETYWYSGGRVTVAPLAWGGVVLLVLLIVAALLWLVIELRRRSSRDAASNRTPLSLNEANRARLADLAEAQRNQVNRVTPSNAPRR